MWGVSAADRAGTGTGLTGSIGWRWVFWVNLPMIAIVAWAAVWRFAGTRPRRRMPDIR